jgi:hypothetical protein
VWGEINIDGLAPGESWDFQIIIAVPSPDLVDEVKSYGVVAGTLR